MWIPHTKDDVGKSFRISNLRLNSEGDFAQLLLPVNYDPVQPEVEEPPIYIEGASPNYPLSE